MKTIDLLSFKYILLFSLFINLFQGFAQQKEISKLENQRVIIQNNIDSLNDSLVKINRKIKKLKLSEFDKVVYDTTAIKANILEGAKLREKPDPYSDLIIELNDNEKVYVYDYENNHFKVCTGSLCGYISTFWVEKNPEIDRFVRKKEAINQKEYLKQKELELSYRDFQLLKKYGKETYNKLKKGLYWKGMTKEMAEISLGRPRDVNKTVGSWGVHEQWIYKDLYLYFENNKLTSYQK